jgi:hypothetical protein
MSNHLEGFISKSNKCHKDYFTKLKYSKAHKEDSLTQTWISHKSHKPRKEVLERAHKGLQMYVFHGWRQHPPKEGELLNLSLKKTSHWKLASKNKNIQF